MPTELWQFAPNLIALLLQLCGLWRLYKASREAQKKLKTGTFSNADGGDVYGNTQGDNSATTLEFLLEEKAKVANALLTIGGGAVLQILALIISTF
jgi:hypothetical protein